MAGQVRMTEGGIGGHIIRFAVPLFFGNLFQQLYTTADSLIIGNLVGNQALAAVSGSDSLIQMLIGFFQGVFLGAGVVISRFYGARNPKNMSKAIHNTLIIALFAGVFLAFAGIFGTEFLLKQMGTPLDIMDLTASYVRTYITGGIFLILYNACMGIMQAVGDSKHPLYYLIFSSFVNVGLDLFFILVLHGGVRAAALATILSQALSVVLCLRRLTRSHEEYRVSLSELRIDRDMFGMVLRFGLPSGLQNSIINFANVVVQSNINAFGTMAVAGIGAHSKIQGFVFLPITSFTAAITTFVGQNLGAEEFERARKGARFGVMCSVFGSEAIGLVIFLFAAPFVAAFTRESEAVRFGVDFFRTEAFFYAFLSASHALSAVLRGAGKAKVPMFVMLLCWCVIRVTFLELMVPRTGSIACVYWVYPLTWSLSTVALVLYTLKADWIHGLQQA